MSPEHVGPPDVVRVDEHHGPTPRPIPPDPEGRKAWSEEFLEDILGAEPGGVYTPWQRGRR